MKTIKNLIFFLILAFTPMLIGCSEDEFDFGKDYDVVWTVSKITSVSPLTGTPGTEITIMGENLGKDILSAAGVTIGTEVCEIISQTDTKLVVIAPTFATLDPMDVAVTNLHNRKFVFETKFKPVAN